MKMKEQLFHDCNVNGHVIKVHSHVRYITIDLDGTVRVWISRPYMFEDTWTGDTEEGFIIDVVQLEPTDTWHHVFDVRQNRFVERYQY